MKCWWRNGLRGLLVWGRIFDPAMPSEARLLSRFPVI